MMPTPGFHGGINADVGHASRSHQNNPSKIGIVHYYRGGAFALLSATAYARIASKQLGQDPIR